MRSGANGSTQANVLCKALALVPHKGSRVGEARHKPSGSRIFGLEPLRTMEAIQNTGNPNRDDQQMA